MSGELRWKSSISENYKKYFVRVKKNTLIPIFNIYSVDSYLIYSIYTQSIPTYIKEMTDTLQSAWNLQTQSANDFMTIYLNIYLFLFNQFVIEKLVKIIYHYNRYYKMCVPLNRAQNRIPIYFV